MGSRENCYFEELWESMLIERIWRNSMLALSSPKSITDPSVPSDHASASCIEEICITTDRLLVIPISLHLIGRAHHERVCPDLRHPGMGVTFDFAVIFCHTDRRMENAHYPASIENPRGRCSATYCRTPDLFMHTCCQRRALVPKLFSDLPSCSVRSA